MTKALLADPSGHISASLSKIADISAPRSVNGIRMYSRILYRVVTEFGAASSLMAETTRVSCPGYGWWPHSMSTAEPCPGHVVSRRSWTLPAKDGG